MIYPLNQTIEYVMEGLLNPETGELQDWVSEKDLEDMLAKAEMDFGAKVDGLCDAMKNYKADAQDIKEEKLRLAKRQKTAENNRERAKRFIAYLLQGANFTSSRHKIWYQTSKELVIDDTEAFLDWAKQNAPGFLNEPTIRNEDVKKAIQNGMDVPFAHIQENVNMVVR